MLNLRPARKRRAVPLEKTVQSQVVRLLRSVGAKVYVIGRPPRRDSAHKGTGQTPGLPDVLAFVPTGVYGLARECWAVEVKRPGGDPLRKLRPEQAEFRALCDDAEITHVCGGVDDVLALLVQRGLVKETAHYRQASGSEAARVGAAAGRGSDGRTTDRRRPRRHRAVRRGD